MAFSLKTWVNRISEYPNRRKLTHEDGSTELVTVARAEGQISAEGNAFSAEEMNDLENRIKDGFEEVDQSLTDVVLSLANGKIKFGIDASGNYGYIKDGADTVIPFKNTSIDTITLYPSGYSATNTTQYTADKDCVFFAYVRISKIIIR